MNAGRDPREVDYVELHVTGVLFLTGLIISLFLTQHL